MSADWTFVWRRDPRVVFAGDFFADWCAAFSAATDAQAFQNPEWLRAWWETVGAATHAELAVADARCGAARVFLPGVVDATPGRFVKRRTLVPFGGSFCCYTDPLASGGETGSVNWPGYWNAMRRRLVGVADQLLFRFVHPEKSGGGETCGEPNPTLNLEGKRSLDELLADCSANHRGDVRRRLRRGPDFGGFELWVPTSDELPDVLGDFDRRLLPAYGRLWDGRVEGNALSRPGVAEFMRRCLTIGLPAGWCHYSALKIDGRTAAWHIGLSHRSEMYWWIPAHDPLHDAAAPGKTLLALLLDLCTQRGLKRFHFLTGGHAYKLAWKPDPMTLAVVRLHASSWKGRLLGWYDRRRQSTQSKEVAS